METLQINIINPKAKKLIKDLADLGLITIQPKAKNKFGEILHRLRENSDTAPTFEEITDEVELVRAAKYAEKA